METKVGIGQIRHADGEGDGHKGDQTEPYTGSAKTTWVDQYEF